MSRALLATLVCAGVFGTLVAMIAARGASGGSSYTVDAVFDTANGVVGGARVKIAGAVVGEVKRVELAPGPKARIVMEVPRRYAPFRTDARCRILPEGIIAESYVACDPGTAAPLRPTASDGDPTVPLSRTEIPLSLQQFLNVFTAPTSDRMRLMFTELGIATAGRGEDINALLRRSNPALTQADRLLGILDRQRDQLAHSVAQTSRVLDSFATRRGAMRRFVTRAAAASQTPAEHGRALADSFRRFPPMLRSLRPSLRALDRAAAEGTPAMQGLRSAAPAMLQAAERLPGFLTAGTRAIPPLAHLARVGQKAERDAAPLLSHINQAGTELAPFAQRANPFWISVRDRGGLEGFLRAWYGNATFGSAYDDTSHMFADLISVFPQCLQNPPEPTCSSRYDAPGQGKIPPDDPACGPRDQAPWNPLTDCGPNAGSADGRRSAGHRQRGERARPHRQVDAPSNSVSPAPPSVGQNPAPVPSPKLPPVGPIDLPDPNSKTPAVEKAEALLDYLLGP